VIPSNESSLFSEQAVPESELAPAQRIVLKGSTEGVRSTISCWKPVFELHRVGDLYLLATEHGVLKFIDKAVETRSRFRSSRRSTRDGRAGVLDGRRQSARAADYEKAMKSSRPRRIDPTAARKSALKSAELAIGPR